MRPFLRRAGTLLLFLLVALCFAPTLVPPFLDRIYYQGPVSDHFDGARFFNPDRPPHSPRRSGFFGRWTSSDRARWPESVAVTPSLPPRRVDGEHMRVTWIGHATVLVQAQGLNILTDPIWSERASPVSFAGPRRVRAPGIRFEDLPRIDLVLVSHNHYDHLDLPTLRRLWRRDRPLIVTGLGNEVLLARSGVQARAADWGETVPVRPGIAVTVLRNHHWSSRWGTDRNRALWSAFSVHLPGGNLFFAGDTAFGDGAWVREAARHGPYRVALLPIGAYSPRDYMRFNHIDPGEALRVFEGLGAAHALGIHWGTFQLSFEAIDAPPRALAGLTRARGLQRRFVTLEVGRPWPVPARSAAAPPAGSGT